MKSATIEVLVTSSRMIAQDIRELRLARPDGLPLPAFTPGAHVDLHLGPGLVRQYSLCGAPDDSSHYMLAVKLEAASRGGSKAVHGQLQEGVSLAISPPRNNFTVAAGAAHSVLVAGGIGITPLLSMALDLRARGQSFELLYFSRSPAHMAFRSLLQQDGFAPHCRLLAGLPHAEVQAELSRALGPWREGMHLYLCGPQAFMDAVLGIARTGWPAGAVHTEYFTAAPATGPQASFCVTLARSGRSVNIAENVSIIDALRAAGVAVDTACEQGVCGTCITPVLQGLPDHRDLFLSAAEKARGDQMALCVSRALTPLLVLDL